MKKKAKLKVAVIVAHPDDETLWAGGTLVSHENWDIYIASLCRAKDDDRAPKFYKALRQLKAKGIIGDLNDEPKQQPLPASVVEQSILSLLPFEHFDLIITHSPVGEYTRHVRHEEVSKAVIHLWNDGKISTNTLWMFAYEDGLKTYLPRPIEKADIFVHLSNDFWLRKYEIITNIYGFEPNSWEAQTTPKEEAFWEFTEPKKAKQWMENLLILNKNQPVKI